MTPELLARATTTALVREAVERFGPVAQWEIEDYLDESPRSVGSALNRLLLDGSVRTARRADRVTVLYAARGM